MPKEIPTPSPTVSPVSSWLIFSWLGADVVPVIGGAEEVANKDISRDSTGEELANKDVDREIEPVCENVVVVELRNTNEAEASLLGRGIGTATGISNPDPLLQHSLGSGPQQYLTVPLSSPVREHGKR